MMTMMGWLLVMVRLMVGLKISNATDEDGAVG